MRYLALVFCIALIGCPASDLEPGSCLDGNLLGEACAAVCQSSDDCLLDETCSSGFCVADEGALTIKRFEVPNAYRSGPVAEVQFAVTGADELRLVAKYGDDPVESILDGSNEFFGTKTLTDGRRTTLTLVALRAGEPPQMRSATIEPIGTPSPAVIEAFTANPTFVRAGETSRLSWDVSNARTVSLIRPSTGLVDIVGPEQTRDFVIQENETFELVAMGLDGSMTNAFASVVVGDEALINEFSVFIDENDADGPIFIYWQTVGMQSVRVTPGVQEITYPPRLALGGFLRARPSTDADYRLFATPVDNSGVQQASFPFVLPPPSVVPNLPQFKTFEISNPPVNLGDGYSVRFEWTTEPSNAFVEVVLEGTVIANVQNGTFEYASPLRVNQRLDFTLADSGAGQPDSRSVELLQPLLVNSADANFPVFLLNDAPYGTLNSLAPISFEKIVAEGDTLVIAFTDACEGGQHEVTVTAPGKAPVALAAVPGRCPEAELIIEQGGVAVIEVRLAGVAGEIQTAYEFAPYLIAARCGDGRRTGTEQCDDGDLQILDGCNNVCEFEDGYQYVETAGPPLPDLSNLTQFPVNFTPGPMGNRAAAVIALPFEFQFFGKRYRGTTVHSNGTISFLPDSLDPDFNAQDPLSQDAPNAVISLFGLPLAVGSGSVTYAYAQGEALIVTFTDVATANGADVISGRIAITENGDIALEYARGPTDLAVRPGLQAAQSNFVLTPANCPETGTCPWSAVTGLPVIFSNP